jgi:alpha-N-arabinofuranosidase
VEYCNGTQNTALANLRRSNGCDAPHAVKYWSIGNEVDGPWQIGFKTPDEYARAYTEFAKVMRWTDPSIKLIAAAVSHWGAGDFVERCQRLLEHAPDHIDYMAIHWYVGNKENNFENYMALSELFEERLAATEGIIRAMRLARGIKKPIHIAVDEWNVWYRTGVPQASVVKSDAPQAVLEEHYNLEDALMTGIQLNAFIRHARAVRMANLAQIVNVIPPITTRKDGLMLESIFYPFEIYSRECGDTALDVFWSGETFEGGGHAGLRVLDVSATLDSKTNRLAVFVVNRSQDKAQETKISLTTGQFAGKVKCFTVNGADIKVINTFDKPDAVRTRKSSLMAKGKSFTHVFEPHSVTALVFELR